MARATNKGENTTNEGAKFQRVAAITVPTFSIKNVKEGESLYVRAVGEIVSKEATEDDGSPKLETKGANKGKQAYLHLLRIVDLSTGEMGEMVLPFLVHKALAESGELNGRGFELLKGKERTGKTTEWSVFEIAVD